jgi:cytosine/adenosine deaminase-related metal-dependent hydrolase
MAEPREPRCTLTARWVFPVAGPPLEHGAITIRGEKIEAVEPLGTRTPDMDLGHVAVVPGFANAHTHLDLTGADHLIADRHDFVAWLRRVIAYRRSRTEDDTQRTIRAGFRESTHSGTTLLADISGDGSSWPILEDAPVRAIVFRELLGLNKSRAAQAFHDIKSWLERRRSTATCRPGLSPHAPYSVRRSIFSLAAAAAVPSAVHLAETQSELELLALHGGSFQGFLKELGVWDPEGLVENVGQVVQLFNGPAAVLFIHANYLPLDTPIPANASIVFCPRTHFAFGHPPHPFRDFLARGVRVALGTDSLASNPDLSVLNEARFVHARYPDFSMAQLLRMATLSGAEALGWADECGSLEPGKSADLVVVGIPTAAASDPHQLLFESTLPVERVMCRGRWIHGSP